jgi:fatty-acyl-CoA synthase
MTFVKNYWRFVERQGVTMLGCVPTVLAGLMNVPVDGADIRSVRIAWTGGSPLPNELAAAFEKQTGLAVRNLFGMTESAGLVSITPTHGKRIPGSTGLRLPFTDVKAFRNTPDGPDMGRICAPNETGVIALRGPHISPGYTDPARNEGVFTEDGWLISGDLGWVDGDGQVFLTGRAKDVIIRGGHNIDPAMIEEIVSQHPAVEMCAAIGQPDAYAGELPMVYVTLKPGETADEAALLDFIAERIPEQPAMPKRAVIVDQMPLTAIGKIYKPTLRARAIEHVIAETLAPLAAAGRGLEVRAVDEGGQLTAEITLPAGAKIEAEARHLLRDFAIEYRIAAG